MKDITVGHILSKTSFIRGIQCPRSLYLDRYHPELRDEPDPYLQDIFQQGIDTGILARGLFPGGVEASPEESGNYLQAARRTKELISDGVTVIYEAAFQHEGVLCLADILVRTSDGWDVYEVKSSTKVSDVYLLDGSLQYHVINGAGININNFFIVYINKKYVRNGALDIHSLFISRSIKKYIKKNQKDITNKIFEMKKVLASDEMPDAEIGEHCRRPYRCDFTEYCWRHIPENSVFDIIQIGHKAFSLYRKGILKMEDVPEDFPLSNAQRLQIECLQSGEDYINYGSIKEFLDQISYPLYFMDFETFNNPVPLYDNVGPYKYIPFQYSLHYRKNKGEGIKHYEYLAEPGTDPRREFIERLLEDTAHSGDILVYNKSFESARLRELAEYFPEYRHEIDALIVRIIDLMIPFQKKYYYSPAMKGRYSIKYVLPALMPDMSYSDMIIGNGREAMKAFESLKNEGDENRKNEIRGSLLDYCKMDTLALVKLLEKLEEIAEEV